MGAWGQATLRMIQHDGISELKELWEEDGDLPLEWYLVLDNLAARLQ